MITPAARPTAIPAGTHHQKPVRAPMTIPVSTPITIPTAICFRTGFQNGSGLCAMFPFSAMRHEGMQKAPLESDAS